MSHSKEKIILGDGELCVYSADSSVTGLNNNVAVIGGSGSGKTVSIIEARLLEAIQRSLIVTVTKRRIVKKYASLLKKRGYRVLDLNFVHPLSGNVGFDPLKHISDCAGITFLAKSLVLANPQKEKSAADPYWDSVSISLLCAEIDYIMLTKDHPTFSDVLAFHSNLKIEEGAGIITTNYDHLFSALEEIDPNCFAVNCWKSFRQLPIKTASCVFSTLNTTLDSIFTPELMEMFKLNTMVDFEQLATRKTVLFVTSSPVNPSINFFISIFYGTAFKELFEFAEDQPNGELPIHVDVLADDFATGCPVNQFDKYISIFREKGISSTILIQSESQLSSLYGIENATTIINNCDSIVYMGSMDISSARDISLRANRPLEDILYMPLGHQILFRRGQKPIFGRRYNIMENETYKKITAEYEESLSREQSR